MTRLYNDNKYEPVRRLETIAISCDSPGSVTLRGMFSGAICWHYRCVSIKDGVAVHELVEPRSVRNDNGTFSTVYEVVS